MSKEEIQAWQKQRNIDVTGPQGDLSLIAMHDLAVETHVKEIAGLWKPSNEKSPGLTLTATASDELYINGKLVEGTVNLVADITVVQAANGITAMATSQPGSLHLLAIWDEHCPALKTFSHIDHFEYNEHAIFTGKLIQGSNMVEFSHTADTSTEARTHESIGVIKVEIDGENYSLVPFKTGPYSIVIFRDATSGNETYGMGRMLVIDHLDDDTVQLDFNKAFLPPCAFSPYFNCPMPPLGNRIQSKVKAGEKQIISFTK